MADNTSSQPDNWTLRPPARLIAESAGRVVALVAALLALYYLLPLDDAAAWEVITFLAVGLAAFIGLVIFQVRWIRASEFPGMKALEALASCVPWFIVLFASAYFVLERLSPGNFSAHLTRSDSLYFTVTVFTTVGFGDITAKTDLARLLVTSQMIIDVIIVGLVVEVIFNAARSRRSQAGGTKG